MSDAERASRVGDRFGVGAASLVMDLYWASVRHGISQREVARFVGVAANSVRDWHTGRDLPTVRHLCGWARAVGLHVVLVDGHGVQLARRAVERRAGEGVDEYERRRLGLLLRKERSRLRMIQREVAGAVGLTRVTITHGERDGPKRVADFVSWAAVVGCSVRAVSDAWRSAGG